LKDEAEIGVIGGSGLYEMEGLEDVRELSPKTPFGDPSDALVLGGLGGRRVAFLPRHGRGHRILPGELNYRANIYAMKQLGVQWIVSVSAVGSLKEALRPLEMAVPDQFFDRTTQRESSFFGRGLVAHVSMARPFCPRVSGVLEAACRDAGAVCHMGGTYLSIEGPQFSTRAESEVYRSWGMDVIGMTNIQEARLAREAEICYATLAMITDYDCWHPDHDSVTADQIIANLVKNAVMAKSVVRAAIKRLPAPRDCECATALKHALVTAKELVPQAVLAELEPLVGKYMR
jgi:5'-methylthioadenosine phosphorylase